MEKRISYYDYAENDYNYLKDSVEECRFANMLASASQNTCERYLKHVIDITLGKDADTRVMHTHSLSVLLRYIEENIKDFDIDEDIVLRADIYYYNTRYPGDDSFIANEKDIRKAFAAATETKRAVDKYLSTFKKKKPVALNEIDLF